MKFTMIHENYNVADLQRSLAFYEKALGLTEKRRQNMRARDIIVVARAVEIRRHQCVVAQSAFSPEKFAEFKSRNLSQRISFICFFQR